MATDHSGGDGKENRNNTMNISVFCGASHMSAAKMHE